MISDFLRVVFEWPKEKIITGEIFDILLQDNNDYPVVTIETKTPYHKASKKEKETFEERLVGYGTLRTAYFTNGEEWTRLDIFAPTGKLEIRDRFELDVNKNAPNEIEAFFSPLFAERYHSIRPRSTRHRVSSDKTPNKSVIENNRYSTSLPSPETKNDEDAELNRQADEAGEPGFVDGPFLHRRETE